MFKPHISAIEFDGNYKYLLCRGVLGVYDTAAHVRMMGVKYVQRGGTCGSGQMIFKPVLPKSSSALTYCRMHALPAKS